MPELPEVEVAKRSLAPVIGRRIRDVRVYRAAALRTHTPAAFARALRGRIVRELERRGKTLVIAIDGLALLFHFKLWAIVRFHPAPPAPDSETGAILTFADGSLLEFRELQLSEIHLYPTGRLEHAALVAGLGVDPLSRSFTRAAFGRALEGARGAIKNALTDQTRIAGVGNLWVHEILHRARIAPERSVASLGEADRKVLYQAMRTVLREAVRKGGEPEFVDALGRGGRFPLAVYGRAGRPCPRDGAPVRKGRLGGRPSFWCAACQR